MPNLISFRATADGIVLFGEEHRAHAAFADLAADAERADPFGQRFVGRLRLTAQQAAQHGFGLMVRIRGGGVHE